MNPLWHPLMTEANASIYTSSSYYGDQNFYHGTNLLAAQKITVEGAIISSSNVNSYGDGFYLAFDKYLAIEYAQQQAYPAVLTAKVDVKKPKKFRDSLELDDFLDQNDIQYNDFQSMALSRVLLSQGYDAIEIGGNQILVIIFSRQQIAVFKLEAI